MTGYDVLRLVVSIVICEGAGFVGSIFTIKSVNGWYRTLRKPPFTPPDAVFGPVWLTLYLLMAIAVFMVWREGLTEPSVLPAFIFFWGQLVLNVLWSVLFFGLRSPRAGLINIVFLWLAILVNIILFFKVSVPAALLLIPYLIWVSIATYLNAGIWYLNQNK